MRVVIADDHPLVRDGIRAALSRADIDVVAEAPDGDAALRLVREHKPDLLILDLSMGGLPFDQVIPQAQEAVPGLKTLVLTAHDDDAYVRKIKPLAIRGYMLKDEAPESLAQAVRVIQQGAVWFSQVIARKMMDSTWENPTEVNPLTAREATILAAVAQAKENGEIAHSLNLAEQTVRNYVSTIYHKIGATSRIGAAVWAREHGLV